jgi:hypothetical protein
MPRKRLALTKITPYKGAPRPEGVDDRLTSGGLGQQGRTTCSRCAADVTIKKADTGDINEDLGVKRHDLIVSPHRVGGGKVSIRGGDVPCLGSRLPIAR